MYFTLRYIIDPPCRRSSTLERSIVLLRDWRRDGSLIDARQKQLERGICKFEKLLSLSTRYRAIETPRPVLIPLLHLLLHHHVIVASVLRSVHGRGARPLFTLRLAPPHARLSLISRHLENRPPLPLNTPFSSERSAEPFDDVEYNPLQRSPITPVKAEDDIKMSQQAEHPTLLIPGPIEFDDAVLQSMGHFR